MEPNEDPVTTITAASSMHLTNSASLTWQTTDEAYAAMSHHVKLGTTSGGNDVLDTTVSGSTGGSVTVDLTDLNLAWDSADQRYEKRIYMTVTTSDGYDGTDTKTKTITVYNYRPDAVFSTSGLAYKIHQGDSFNLSLQVWEPNKEVVSVQAQVDGKQVSALLIAPSSKPSSANATLALTNLSEGTYNAIQVTLTDQYGYINTKTWTGSIVVKDVIGYFDDRVADMGFKELDSLSASLVSDITIPETAAHVTTAASIDDAIDSRDAETQFIGTGANASLFEGEYDNYTTSFTQTILDSITAEWNGMTEVLATAFIPGDEITYTATFSDQENDYQGLTAADKIGGAVTEDQQQWKSGSLIYKLEHDPSVFDDPPAIHSKHQATYTSLSDLESDVLVKKATNDMRGLWYFSARGEDATGNLPFDRYSTEVLNAFYVHLEPEAAAFYNETASTLTLYGTKAYDPDAYTRDDKGIPEGNYTWRLMTSDNIWHDHAGKTSEEVINRTYGGHPVTRFSQTVEDLLGATDTKYYDINFDLSLTVNIDKGKPYQLEEGEIFNVEAVVTTDQTITSMDVWVDEFEGNLQAMNYQSKIGQRSTYSKPFTVTSAFEEKDYLVFVRCRTLEGSDETRVGIITILNNVPPEHLNFTTSPSVAYTGDEVRGTFTVNDDDDQVLTQDVAITKGGTVVNTLSQTITPVAGVYAPVDLTLLNNATDGTYTVTSTLTDPYGATDVKVYTFDVERFIINGTMLPADPMAGDELIWNIHSEGAVERFELILDPEVEATDRRVEMGYDPVTYPVTWNVDENQLVKDSTLEYILWCTTTESLTLKGVRNRPAYDFTIRAYIGAEYRDFSFTREVSGDVRQLIKTGYKTQ